MFIRWIEQNSFKRFIDSLAYGDLHGIHLQMHWLASPARTDDWIKSPVLNLSEINTVYWVTSQINLEFCIVLFSKSTANYCQYSWIRSNQHCFHSSEQHIFQRSSIGFGMLWIHLAEALYGVRDFSALFLHFCTFHVQWSANVTIESHPTTTTTTSIHRIYLLAHDYFSV